MQFSDPQQIECCFVGWNLFDSIGHECLLHLTESWVSALDRGHKVGVLFIDFFKAFDCVDHVILADKLKAVGLAGDMWKWINDYLSNRMQGTSVNKSRSGAHH